MTATIIPTTTTCPPRKLFLLALVMPFIAGCASLETFQNMSAQERADFVCEHDPDYSHTIQKLSRINNVIHETQEALFLGVRFFSVCKNEIGESLVKTTSCKPNKEGGEDCTTTKKEGEQHTVCNSFPIPINAALEERKLEASQEQKYYLEDLADQIYGECFDFVIPMTAEQAFAYYENN